MGRKRKAKASDREDGSDSEEESSVKKRTSRGGEKKKSFRELAFPDMDSSSDDEDPNVCPVCGDRNDPNPIDNKNRMIGCDGSCEKWFHWSCVGINLTNKPGKKDDWFCKKCSSKKTESGEWKPEVGEEEEEGLDVLPLRDQAPPVLKTLAEKKSYDSTAGFPQKARGRPPGSRVTNGRKSSASKGRESWSTSESSSPKLPPGISGHPLISGVSKSGASPRHSLPPSEQAETKKAQHRLPPGISISSAFETPSPQSPPQSPPQTGKVQHRLPPGISISSSSETPSPQLPPQIPRLKPNSADVQLRKIPAGISVIPERDSNNEENSEDSFLNDLEFAGDSKSGSPEAKKENCATAPVISSGIKLIKINENKSQPSPNQKKNDPERQLRARGHQMAKIKATIDEGDISDDELFGTKKIVYRKPTKPSPSKEFEPTPIEELLKEDLDDSNEGETEPKLGTSVPSQTEDDVLKNVKNPGHSQEKVSSSEPAEEKSEKVKENGENTRALWEAVEDETGKKGLSLVTKTYNDIVIKPYNNTGTSQMDESNKSSSSRLDDTEKSNVKSKSTNHIPEESSNLENQEMDLRLSQELPFIDSLEDIINKTSVQSQKDEAEIQKIKQKLTADLEGSRVISTSSNGSLIQQSPLNLPNTRFSHQLPQTILQPPATVQPMRSAVPPTNTISLSSPSVSSSNGNLMIPKIDDYIDGDNDANTREKVSIKVLKPGELNTKAEGETKISSVATLATPTQLIKVSTSFSPSNLPAVQSPTLQPNIVGAPGGSGGKPQAFILNRLQSPGQLAGPGVIRISAPSPVSVPVSSLVMSHPPQLSGSPLTRPAASPRGRGRGGPRVRGPRPPRPPGMRMVRPGGARMMRPRGPPPPGMRLVRPGGAMRGARPGGPRPVRPGGPPASAAPPHQPQPQPQQPLPGMAPVPQPKPLKVECIDLSDDDDEPAPPPAKSATFQKLNNLGISISRQKPPQIPQGVRLPPGISLSAPGSSSSKRSSSSGGASNGESSRKRVSVDHNVASALNTVTSPTAGSEPKQKVELELNSKQMEALRTLGFL